jgi:diguanylate cyclase (GGDEF)-like protein
MASFKVKLVLYFLLLSLLPVAAAFWGFSTVAAHGETQRVDARLQAGLRAGLAAYQQKLDGVQALATGLAQKRAFQRALEHGDKRALARMLGGARDITVVSPFGLRVGTPFPLLSARRTADVFTKQGLAGSVIAFVPFDTRLAAQLRKSSGLSRDDALIILDGKRIVASSPPVFGFASLKPGTAQAVTIGGARYRALGAGSLDEFRATRLAVISPQRAIDAAAAKTRERLLVFMLAVLVLVAIVAYFEGRSIVRNLAGLVEAARGIARGRLNERVPVRGRDEFAQLGHAFNEMADQLQERLAELESERERLREAFARFADALGATHDPDQLLRVVLDTAVQATGAAGAAIVGDARAGLLHVGEIEGGGDRLELPLNAGRSSFGTLVLVGDSFDEEARLTATSLAAQAVVALENARLHGIVERQALADDLTGLANRRRCEEALSAELARAERFGTSLTVAFADLDEFKAVNDRHGHPCGDLVLREFAAVLRATVREADVAGRWGGEEFLLLLPGTDAAGGAQLAERIRVKLASRVVLAPDGTAVGVTCSFGLASYPALEGAGALLAAADEALYRAKRNGKNRVEVADELVRRP